MAIFIEGLNKEIVDVVKLQHSMEMEHLLYNAKLKSRSSKSGSSSSWRSNWVTTRHQIGETARLHQSLNKM